MLYFRFLFQKKGRLTHIVFLIIVTLLLSGCNTSVNGAIRVGMVADHAPWEEKLSDTEATGISADLLKHFSEQTGRAIKIIWVEQEDLYKALSDGRIDCILSSAAITDINFDKFLSSDPYTKSYPILLIRKDAPITSKVELNKATTQIAVISNTVTESFAKSEYSNAVIRTFNTRSEAAASLIDGSCDVFVDDPLSIFSLSLKYPNSTRLNPAPLTDKFQYFTVYVSPKYESLVSEWNDFFARNRESGLFDTLREKYVVPYQPIMDQYNIEISL